MRRLSAAVALIVALASCSSGSPRASRSPGEPPASASPSASASVSASPSASASGTSAPPASPTRAAVPDPVPTTPAAAIPAAGRYVYAQQGTETLCSGSTCSTPRPLPPQMTATVTRPAGAQVVVELRIADGRLVRMTSTFGSRDVWLDELYAEFTEGAITQSGAMRPSPPVRLLTLPLQSGRWNGSFTDGDAQGTYAFRTIGTERINAAGSLRSAWRVEGTITVEGEEGGTLALTMWIDPATNAFLRLKGDLDVRSTFGSYSAEFTDTLSSGPGY